MASIALGRYVAHDSFIHRLDPRNKILSLIILMVAIFFQFSTFEVTFLVDGFLFVFIAFLLLLSHVKIKDFFKSLSALWLVLIILFIINIFVPVNNREAYGVAWTMWGYDVYWASIFQSIKILMRLVLMISLTLILTATTKPMDLTFALEWFFSPLKVIKFPAHEIAMTLSIALRFIPTILDETYRIMKAQASRGVDFKRGGFKDKIKAITSLIIPLFISAFERSEELANAMEARGYDPKAKRTRYHKMHWSVFDTITFLLTAILLTGVILIHSFGIVMSTPTFIPWFIVCLFILFFIIIFIGVLDSKRKSRL